MAKLTTEERNLLTTLTSPVKSRLRLAWGMSVCATLLLVVQAWVLATLFGGWFAQSLSNIQAVQTVLPSVLTQWSLLFLLIICLVMRPIFGLFQGLIGAKASLSVRTALRQRLITALASLGMARQAFGSDGSLSSQVIEQTDALDGYISRFMVQKQVVLTTPLILLVACAWQNLAVAGILFLTAPLVPILMIVIGKMTAKKSEAQFSALAQLSGRFLDWVRGMTTLKRLQATEIATADLYNASEDYRHRTMAVLKIAFLNGAVLELLSAVSIALVAMYLGYGLLETSAQPNPASFFSALFILFLVPEFYAPLRQLGMDYHAQAQAQGAIKGLSPILQQADSLNALSATLDNSTLEPTNSQSNLDYSQAVGITFNALAIYQTVKTDEEIDVKVNANKTSVNKVTDTDVQKTDTTNTNSIIRTRLAPTTFNIDARERVGLIGESGSGKSSLLQALLGFSDYQGTIEISDNERTTDHRQLNIHTFRQHTDYLAQQIALLPMSIADNLRLAKPTASDDELIAVLQAVELYELIKQLPQGMQTKLGERGKGLSGGQQQRLGMAQLLLRDAKLWLLDEPTEHLDPDTAQRIHRLLETLSRGKTVIWITHSIEQLPWLDRIIELKTEQEHTQPPPQHQADKKGGVSHD